MKQKILFIINPIAGHGSGKIISTLLMKYLDGHKYEGKVVYTKYASHGFELARMAAEDGYDVVAAVGGDGTVNEIACALTGTDTALAIIPRGSGNGLANHLNILPTAIGSMISVNKGERRLIDTALFNGHPFFCTAGVGYDAKVAADYSKAGKRGLLTYTKKALADWLNYKPDTYHVTTDSSDFDVTALLITCGNANEWGNNFHIAPGASLTDGLLDLTIVHPVSVLQALPMPLQLIRHDICNNFHVDSLRTRHLRIERKGKAEAHYDGESIMAGNIIDIECKPSSLYVICPAKTNI